MITLYNLPPGWGAPSLSPFCIKAIYMLNAAGVDYEIEDVDDPRRFPQGKLPAIKAGNRIIGDSDNIRAYLSEIGHDIDAHLTDQQKAEGVAWQRLCEEHLYYHQVLDRWLSPDLWPRLKKDYFGSMPFPVKHIIPYVLRRSIRAGLFYLGHARQSEKMRHARLNQDLDAIRTRLSDRVFLFGDEPSTFDASLGAMLRAMRSVPLKTPVSTRVLEDEVLVAYADRVAAAMGSPTS